jgi:hypothetical protein
VLRTDKKPKEVFREYAFARRCLSLYGLNDVCAADPEIIFASWYGKPVNTDQIAGRDGWNKVSAIRAGDIHPLNSRL